jgi:hypothetical protein
VKKRCKAISNWARIRPLAGLALVIGFLSYPLQAQDQPLVSIVAPTANSTFNGGAVQVEVQFGNGANLNTFTAEVNGIDITSLFNVGGGCGSSGICNLQASVPYTDLLNGMNIVSAEVTGLDDSADVALVKFQYTPPSASATDPVSKMIPSISIQAVNLPSGSDQNNVNSYQIILGPGPGFPKTIYTTANLTCSANINSAQVLVLTRQTLVPDTRIVGGTGQACLGNAASLTSFLQTLPKGDLVILNTFLGTMANINTTAIGGTDFSKSTLTPRYYNAIGVAGATPGTVYESYQPNLNHTSRIGRDFLPALTGSLMLDTRQNYYFVPSSYPEVNVVPGTSANNNCATITYAGTPYTACATGTTTGGFLIVAVDRLLGYVTDQYVLPTNNTSASGSKQAINDFAYLLQGYYKANDLVIITTFGTPIGSSAPVNAYLWNEINRLGGNGYRLAQLTTNGSTFTLISSNDPEYQRSRYPLQNTSLNSANGETGQVHGVLSRDRLNRLALRSGASDAGILTYPLGYAWSAVVFQQPQDWPTWTTGQQNAYLDLTSTANHYPTLRAFLSCGTNECPPIRSRYDTGFGSAGTKPSILSFNYSTIAYVNNSSYVKADFDAVITQLEAEQGYVSSVYDVYALLYPLGNTTGDTIQKQLQAVAKQIQSSIQVPKGTSITVDDVTKAAAVTGLLAVVPAIGPAFGVVSASLYATAAFMPSDDGVPNMGRFGYTLAQLQSDTSNVNSNFLASLLVEFTSIANDWGKLSIIGPGWGSQQAPWFMCTGCIGANLPANSIEAFALGAKRQFYLSLLPTVYDNDIFVEQPQNNPALIKGNISTGVFTLCVSAYANVPSAAFWSYPSINYPKTWDIYTLTQITMGDVAGGPSWLPYRVAYFPSSGLLSDLFGAPTVVTSTPPFYTLGGGAGLTQDQLMSSGGYLASRLGYIPYKQCK